MQIAELPIGWNSQRDGSVRAGRGLVAIEIVSPILKGSDGIAQVKTVCAWLRSKGARVNRSTGLHVHVGFDKNDAALLQKLVGVVANLEKAVYASTGTKSRERGSYCRSVQASVEHQQGQLGHVCRYHVLNVQTGKPTVEFRAFAGTINFVKIVAHVMTCLGIVEKTLKIKKTPAWIAKTPVETSPVHRGGEGLTALNRMFYWLGWTKGTQNGYVFGAIEGMPKVKTMKNQLVKLAKKYDATV